jgi:hypothetical protein
MLEEEKRTDGEDQVDEQKEEVVDEVQCKMVAQLCAETIIKHNLNAAQMGRCDLQMFIDEDNSKEVRKYFELFKKDARKNINARALQLHTSWHQSVFCLIMSRHAHAHNRKMWDELKDEFLEYATKKEENK